MNRPSAVRPRATWLSAALVLAAAWLPPAGARAGEGAVLLHGDNMKELRCDPPNEDFRFVGSGAPGQLFVGDERVALDLVFKRGNMKGTVPFALEIQEIGTRTPGKVVKSMEGWSDTAGHAPIVDLIGKPARHDFKVEFGDAAEERVELRDVRVPERFGTYAVVLVRGDRRQFLCTLARVPKPDPKGTVENVPIFGEGQFLNGDLATRARIYARMGIRGWRSELSWSEREDGSYDWGRYDALFAAAKGAGCKIMVTLGGHPSWTWPFRTQTPAAVGYKPNWDGSPYWGQADWLCDPKLYPRYEKWIAEFSRRYWEGGKGGLWGLENYNEPWEGGGISGWARDCIQYREIQRTIARAARSVDRRIRLLAASSIMNTEDKLYSDGSGEFDEYVDIFTDHYVPPCMSYGPMVAKSRGKESMETETWFVGTEYQLPQGVAQFIAAGQTRISPWHPRALFVNVPGGTDATLIPTPVVAATAAFNKFVTGRPFEKIVFRTHLPWVFQFGKDDDPGALLVLFGQMVQIGGSNPKESLWPQVDTAAGGEIEIDNADGLLQFYDLAGNPAHVGEKKVTLPMNIFPTYITCRRGPRAAAERLARARITGKRPVEILPRDFPSFLTEWDVALEVAVHNCLNRAVRGSLAVEAPPGVSLTRDSRPVELEAGETKVVEFPVGRATPAESNAYPFKFRFDSDAGGAEYGETLSVTVAPLERIAVDGDLGDWKAVPAVSAFASKDRIDPTELMRRPWLEVKGEKEEIVAARVRLAWDERALYVAAEVRDSTPEGRAIRFADRDEDAYFHVAADDDIQPFKRFLETQRIGNKTLKELGRSFAEVPYVYARPPEAGIPFRRDRLHVAFDVTDGWHDFEPTTDRVPYGYHTVPDTDYEWSLYLCDDGKGESWRHLAPGVPRIHDFPRQPRGERTTCASEGVRVAVRRTDDGYVYEVAIPRDEMPELKLEAGTSFGFVFKIGNSGGAQPEYGHDKAVTKQNGLTLHPYWERSPSCGVRWTLVR